MTAETIDWLTNGSDAELEQWVGAMEAMLRYSEYMGPQQKDNCRTLLKLMLEEQVNRILRTL